MLFEKIKSDLLSARKAREADKAMILSTALGEMSSRSVMIDGQKVVSDDVALSTIKKFIKGIDETLAIVQDSKLQQERETLNKYLPQTLSDTELTNIIQDAIDDGHANMGGIMGILKSQYPNLYDGKTASIIATKLLKKD